ncbi:MAG: sulfotransferase, partial [Rickettsiales bacterium]|nr:sulfotransferase [Rickettsiales bacterium]
MACNVAAANLFIIGLPRAATTALAQSLSRHPDIFLSRLKHFSM